MITNRQDASFHSCLLVLAGLAAITCLPQMACGQPKHKPQIIDVSIDAKKEGKTPDIELRPNTPTEIGVKLKNNADEILDVTIKIIQVVDGKPRVIAEAEANKLAKAEERIVELFDKIKDNPEKLDL